MFFNFGVAKIFIALSELAPMPPFSRRLPSLSVFLSPLSHPLAQKLLVGASCLVLAACGVAPIEPPPVSKLPRVIGEHSQARGYARIIQTAPDSFTAQTGSRLFRKAGAPDIDLVGAIHIAQADYYQRLQQRLDQSDLVLFEGVTARKSDGTPTGGENKGAYKRMADSLGLVVQNSGIDYSRKSFRRCDLSLEEMVALLDQEIAQGGAKGAAAADAKKEFDGIKSMLSGKSLLTNLVIGLVGTSPLLREQVLMMTVSSGLGNSEEKQLSPRLKQLILQDRNAHVSGELRKLLISSSKHRRIAIFFGAAHLPDFERRLRSMGYSPVAGPTWNSAITTHPYSAGIPREEVREAFGE